MRKLGCFGLVLFLAAAVTLAASAGEEAAQDAQKAFERLKGLVGNWEATTPQGTKVSQVYELTAGGSALVERFIDQSADWQTMVTVYYLDADRLLLTHYCAANNQPRMLATHYHPGTGRLEFDFLDATNLPDVNTGHMHQVLFQFTDHDHFTTEWTFWREGKPEFTEVLHFNRKQ